MEDDEDWLRKKKAFCQLFDDLENPSDDEDGTNDGLQSLRETKPDLIEDQHVRNVADHSRPKLKPPLPVATIDQHDGHSRLDASSDALLSSALTSAPTSDGKNGHPSTARQNATCPQDPSTMPKVTGKRKRAQGLAAKPQAQQIFEGLNFYFFPNNNVHPARKLRILKAQEYGAIWSKVWLSSISHVIMDKTLDLGSLLKHLKIETLPKHVVIVSENYPAECIAYRSLLDPYQTRFEVKGVQSRSSVRKLPTAPAPNSSPEVKQGRKTSATQRGHHTPPSNASPKAPIIETATASTDVDGHQNRSAREVDCVPDSFANTEASGEHSFDEAIGQARVLCGIPTDDDDDGDANGANSLRKINTPAGTVQSLNHKGNFQCMSAHPAGEKQDCPNGYIIVVLQQMADYYTNTADDWRSWAYRKVISTLRNHPTEIRTREEALALPNVGERLALKIEEIAFTNRLRRLDSALAQPRDQILQTFMKIYGVGFAQATKWIYQGFTTLKDLSSNADLSENQRIGIDHYADFNSRIPRAEVVEHGNTVRKALYAIDPAFQVIIGGSYRRGASTSGDIDCIITRTNTAISHIRTVVMEQLIPQLTAQEFLVAALAITSRDDGTKWHGASCLPPKAARADTSSSSSPWRRIDFLLVPWDEMGAAKIYFTGNDIFNRSLRLLASKKGMRLNQRGLFKDVIRGRHREKVTCGVLVESRDETKIFKILGVPWRPPEQRNC